MVAQSTPLDDPSRLPFNDYLCIDCKSFYASCEAIRHGINPLGSNIVVLSREESNGGLVLASSPYAKKTYGVKLGTRRFELRNNMFIEVVEPHMDYYLNKNIQINRIFRQFTDDVNWMPYSVDESFLCVSGSHSLFGSNVQISLKIQHLVQEQTGIITTIGIGMNPLLAKLALDNAAKKQAPWIATWDYDNIQNTLWKIPKLTDFWGIGGRTAEKLERMGIHSIHDLAHYDVNVLRQRFGILGVQLFYHAWGIDYSNLEDRQSLQPTKAKGYGNSQVLMRDYMNRREVLNVLFEITEQVASRVRKHHKAATIVAISIGYTAESTTPHFSTQTHITATDSNQLLKQAVMFLFDKKYNGAPVRNVAVRCTGLVDNTGFQLDLFSNPNKQIGQAKLDHTIDKIRNRYGYTSLMPASSLLKGSTAIEREKLVGGH